MIQECEDIIVDLYAKEGKDISTKEKRIILPEEAKKEIFNDLVKVYFKLQFSRF